ncbi:MAG TPA: MOSC domain-containing protein [Candidatus Dormibacteraeota bacterium]|nr:MOSC domain-containing protein [Candidatus Dormibacteraeota bacterium]
MATVAELWRYPVKSMRGERLPETPVVMTGIPGDRVRALRRADRLVTARRDRSLLNQPASLYGDLGYEVVEDARGIFDVHPLLLVGMASVAKLAEIARREVDHRRFRANVYLEGLAADEERRWPGRRLRVGSAVLEAVEPCERCVVATLHPDTLEAAPDLLHVIQVARGGMLGVYCRVVEPGYVVAGDVCEPV